MFDPTIMIIAILFFVFGLPMIFLIIFFTKVHKPLEEKKIEAPKEVIVKEIVMVQCQYCGGLMPTTAIQCPNCKSPRKV